MFLSKWIKIDFYSYMLCVHHVLYKAFVSVIFNLFACNSPPQNWWNRETKALASENNDVYPEGIYAVRQRHPPLWFNNGVKLFLLIRELSQRSVQITTVYDLSIWRKYCKKKKIFTEVGGGKVKPQSRSNKYIYTRTCTHKGEKW